MQFVLEKRHWTENISEKIPVSEWVRKRKDQQLHTEGTEITVSQEQQWKKEERVNRVKSLEDTSGQCSEFLNRIPEGQERYRDLFDEIMARHFSN